VYRAKRRSYIFLRISVTTAIVATVLLALSLIGKYVFLHSGHVSTVGGVSGPDSITETVQVISPLFFLDIAERIALILIIAFVLSIICWLLTRIKRK
jgi:hydrogenase maturation factor